MNTTICAGIHSRRVLRCYYDGGYRTMEPHCHGISSAGNEVLSAYQTAGHSESSKPMDWKLFRVSGMSNLTITDESFEGTRPGYNPNDSRMTTIHCHL